MLKIKNNGNKHVNVINDIEKSKTRFKQSLYKMNTPHY